MILCSYHFTKYHINWECFDDEDFDFDAQNPFSPFHFRTNFASNAYPIEREKKNQMLCLSFQPQSSKPEIGYGINKLLFVFALANNFSAFFVSFLMLKYLKNVNEHLYFLSSIRIGKLKLKITRLNNNQLKFRANRYILDGNPAKPSLALFLTASLYYFLCVSFKHELLCVFVDTNKSQKCLNNVFKHLWKHFWKMGTRIGRLSILNFCFAL